MLAHRVPQKHIDEIIPYFQDACIEISALVEKLNTNIGIYSALQV